MDKAKINCAKAKETVIHNSYGKNLFDPLCSHISGEGSHVLLRNVGEILVINLISVLVY